MKRRTLSLQRETLSELTADDLTRVAGAAYDASLQIGTCPVKYCIADVSDVISCTPSCGHSGCCYTQWC